MPIQYYWFPSPVLILFSWLLFYKVLLFKFELQFEANHNKDYSVVKTSKAARKCRFFVLQTALIGIVF